MAFIPARGFLGSIKDIVLRGFNIGPSPFFAMRFNDMVVRELMTSGANVDPVLNSQGNVDPVLSFSADVEPT
jgi:hypothetical protein